MERLLADATKLTGVEYNIDNLGDVYDAIHVVQGELGLTGVAAAEASETFSGSFGAMSASWHNLLGNLTTGQDIGPSMQQLAKSASDFLFKNLVPMIGNVVRQIPNLVKTFINTGLPQIISTGKSVAISLARGLVTGIPLLLDKGPVMIDKFAGKISNALPKVLDKGKEIILKVAEGIFKTIPKLGDSAVKIVNTIGKFLSKNLPVIGKKGGELLQKLASGLVKNLPKIVVAVGKVGLAIIKNVIKIAPKMLKAGIDLIGGLVKGLGGAAIGKVKGAMEKIKTALMEPISKAREKIKGIMDKIKGFFPLSIGKIFSGLKLPHISVSKGKAPFGIGGKGSLPHFSVNWNAKAMDTPYMFDHPTVFGAGEAGSEIMYGHDNLMRDIRNAVGSNGGDININLNYDASDDAKDMLRDLARGIRRYRMAGAI